MGTPGDSGPSSQDTTSISRPESAVIGEPSRKRVGFIPDAPSDLSGPTVSPDPSHGRQILGALAPEEIYEDGLGFKLSPVSRERPDLSHVDLSVEIHKAFGQSYVPKPRPAIRRIGRTVQFLLGDEDENGGEEKRRSIIQAQQRATRLAKIGGLFCAWIPKEFAGKSTLSWSLRKLPNEQGGKYTSPGQVGRLQGNKPMAMSLQTRTLRDTWPRRTSYYGIIPSEHTQNQMTYPILKQLPFYQAKSRL